MNFKSILKKENIMPVAVLSIICLVCAALLGAVNMITEPVITKAEEQKVYDSLREVIDGEFAPAEIPEGASSDITGIFKVTEGDELVGHAVTVSAKGYAGQILMTVGINADGSVKKVVITSQSESHGKAGMATYPDKFTGVASDALADVELFSGATISSTAIKNAVTNAVNAVLGENLGGEEETLPKTDEEIESLAAQLVGDGANLEQIEVSDTEYTKRVYKDKGGKGYVAYVLVISQYGTPETETLVHVGTNGTIVGINKLTWKTSDAMYGYVPPEAATVDAFYAKLPGKTVDNLKSDFKQSKDDTDKVEHVTNATSTSGNLVKALIEAMTEIDTLIKKDMPREESEVESLAAQLVGDGANLEQIEVSDTEYTKRVYKDKGGKGYVAYVLVISQYGTPETETLVHVGTNGTIVGINKLTWKTSDAMYGYVPPEAATVDAFYAKLPGKTVDNLKSDFKQSKDDTDKVEHVTNATSTSGNLVKALIEAMTEINTLIVADVDVEADTSYAARAVGIIILSLAIACPVALGVYTYIKRRKS